MVHTVYYSLLTYSDWSLYLAATDQGLCFVGSSPASKAELTGWVTTHFPAASLIEDNEKLAPYRQAFTAYLAGELRSLDLHTHTTGTAFQKKVWNGLRAIPYGETLSYSELATQIGSSPKAARAVGTALAANPLTHREPLSPRRAQIAKTPCFPRGTRHEGKAACSGTGQHIESVFESIVRWFVTKFFFRV